MFANNTFIDDREYCTNAQDEGLFVWDKQRGVWKQILGTCQFSVRNVKHKNDKIRRTVRKMNGPFEEE